MAWSISRSRILKASGERRYIVIYRFFFFSFSSNFSASDFWELPQSRLAATITDDIERHFYLRCPPEKRPRYKGESSQPNVELERYGNEKKLEGRLSAEMITTPSTRTAVSQELGPSKPEEGLTSRTWFKRGKKDGKPKYDESLFKTIHRTFFARIWTAGVLKLVSGDIYSVFYASGSERNPKIH